MFNTKIVKAIMLGLCLSAFSTGVALAETVDSSTYEIQIESTEGMGTSGTAQVDKVTLDLQEEINKIVFEDNLEKITEKGITVTHTIPVDGAVEVGINPFNQENADFIAELIGKDNVKVVEGIPVELYTSGMAEDTPVVAPDEVLEAGAEDPVVGEGIDITDDMVKITTVDEAAQATDGATDDVLTTTKAEANEEAQLVSDTTTAEKDNNAMPIVIISIAGVVVLLGGIVLLNQKKKASK